MDVFQRMMTPPRLPLPLQSLKIPASLLQTAKFAETRPVVSSAKVGFVSLLLLSAPVWKNVRFATPRMGATGRKANASRIRGIKF